MANEITKLDGDGGLKATLLFLYQITAPVYVIDGGGNQTVIATPSTDLPEMAGLILTSAEKAELDAGTLAFEVVSLSVTDAKTGPELLVDARALYAKRKTRFVELLARKYNRAGLRFNGV